MNLKKLSKIKKTLKLRGKVAVALSGGLDSCALLKLCAETLGAENTLALSAQTPYTSREEAEEAAQLCEGLGVKRLAVKFAMPKTLSDNPKNRCYLCKKILFGALLEKARKSGFETLADGSNTSDLSDFRPGRKAAKQLGIFSPFEEADFSKFDIRALAKHLGFGEKFSNKGANACMLTRFPFGAKIRNAEIKKACEAEKFLRKLGMENPRVRVHGNLARIELAKEDFARFVKNADFKNVSETFAKLGYGFCALDLGGYKMGSFNNA